MLPRTWTPTNRLAKSVTEERLATDSAIQSHGGA